MFVSTESLPCLWIHDAVLLFLLCELGSQACEQEQRREDNRNHLIGRVLLGAQHGTESTQKKAKGKENQARQQVLWLGSRHLRLPHVASYQLKSL